jgi:hypothetical protein
MRKLSSFGIIGLCREATIYDPDVRWCLLLSPEQFTLSNPDRNALIYQLANDELRKGLGLPENLKVVPQLYKLLLYEVGGQFTSHRDT